MRKKLKSLPYSGYDNKDVMDIRTLVDGNRQPIT